MTVVLPLDQMTVPEKLQLMEELWDNLSKSPAALESPDWHKEVLDECMAKAASGQEKFTPWETAKDEIRRSVS
jgi:putative addiction module component (TIGR02574 family)